MKKLVLPLLLLSSVVMFAQKKVECTKNAINVDGNPIADYDGKGGMFSDRKIWIFSPGTKDTLIKIIQSNTDLENPLVDKNLLYTVYFNDAEKSTVQFVNPKGWAFVKEKKLLTLLFNDDLPLLIENGKISSDGVKAFKEKYSFDYETIKKNVNQLNDSIIAMKSVVVNREKKAMVNYIPLDKDILPKFYLSEKHPAYRLYNIIQNDVIIGLMEKEITGGTFAKGTYVIYKKVTPFKIGEYTIEYLPLATTETSPGITSQVTSTSIAVELVGLNTSFKVSAAIFNAAEFIIVESLIGKGLL